MEETALCRGCEKKKPISAFPRARRKCRDCISEYNKSQKVEAKERKKELKSNPENTATKGPKEDGLINKLCTGCNKRKRLEEFGIIRKNGRTSRKNRCFECCRFAEQQRVKGREAEREKLKMEEEAALMALEYPERVKAIERKKLKKHLKTLYGIPVERYDEMLKQQKGLCAICHNPPDQHKRLVVDHDHKTGYVRGLLCDGCNHGLGQFKDSQENLLNAVEYLNNSLWEH